VAQWHSAQRAGAADDPASGGQLGTPAPTFGTLQTRRITAGHPKRRRFGASRVPSHACALGAAGWRERRARRRGGGRPRAGRRSGGSLLSCRSVARQERPSSVTPSAAPAARHALARSRSRRRRRPWGLHGTLCPQRDRLAGQRMRASRPRRRRRMARRAAAGSACRARAVARRTRGVTEPSRRGRARCSGGASLTALAPGSAADRNRAPRLKLVSRLRSPT
jgi:hypothetical protein